MHLKRFHKFIQKERQKGDVKCNQTKRWGSNTEKKKRRLYPKWQQTQKK